MALTLTSTSRDIMCNALVDAFDTGGAGYVIFHDSGHSEVAKCIFNATAFGASSSGVATANAINDDADAAGGEVDHAHIMQNDDTDMLQGTVSEGGGGGDFILTSTTIGVDDVVSITAMTMTMPATPA